MKKNLIHLVKATGKKFAVALSASANRGKTTILRKLADIFRADNNVALVDMMPMKTGIDEMWCFEQDGVRICVVTGGDDAGAVDMGFDFACKNECKVLFCATHYYSNSPSWQQFVNRCDNEGYVRDWQSVKAYSAETLNVMHDDVAKNIMHGML